MTTVKKILIISNDYYPLIGGTVTHTHNLCKSLAKIGLDVDLLTYGDGIKCSDEDLPYNIIRINASHNYTYIYRHLVMHILLPLKSKKYIKQNNYDIVHICCGNHMPLPLRFMHIKKPVIFTVHNLLAGEMKSVLFKNRTINYIITHVLFLGLDIAFKLNLKFGEYNHIISVSEYTKQKLLALQVPEKKITVISNGVSKIQTDKAKYQSVHNKWFTLLVIARVGEHKGQLHLVEAMPRIIQHIPNARCIIAGQIISHDYADRMKIEIKNTGLTEKQVLITGEINDTEISKYLSECDIYIQPSYEEGFCISIAEAMLSGLPVIGTPTGAIPSFLENERGILIDEPNSKLIADAVIEYYDHPEIMKKYAENGQKYIQETYDWESIANKTKIIYQNILNTTSSK